MVEIIKWLNSVLKRHPPQLYECECCKNDFPDYQILQTCAHQLCNQCRCEFEAKGIISYKELPQISELCYICGYTLELCPDGWWRCPNCQWESIRSSYAELGEKIND